MFWKTRYSIKNYLREKDLSPEEILADSIDPHSEHKLKIPLKYRNFVFIYAITILILFSIAARTVYLQVIKGEYYTAMAEDNKMNYVVKKAPRGVVYDHSGVQLVQNVGSFNLIAIPSELPQEKLSEIVEKLNKLVGLERTDIENSFRDCDFGSNEPFLVWENIDLEKAKIFETLGDDFAGLHLEENIVRKYADAPYFAHLLGYVGKVNKEELSAHPDYLFNDYIGKKGIELSYESYLRGENGSERHEVDSLGNLERTVLTQEPKAGSDVVLTIDAELQKTMQNSLVQSMASNNSTKGAAIAIDPRNGKILSMVSLPSFNNNLFSVGISSKDYQDLLNNKNNPLLNKVIGGEYPPGSIFKPLVAVGALEEGVISATDHINCVGALPLVNQYTGEITYKQDWKAHGSVNMYDAIANSCNVYFYMVGGGYKDLEGLGIDNIGKYAKKFGFGSTLGVDLIGEKTGFIPSKEWKQEIFGENWYVGDTYNVAIGQGDVLVTPLQIAAYTAAIANGGTLWQPEIVDKIVNLHKNEVQSIQPKILAENMVSNSNLAKVKAAMGETVKRGSAISLLSLPVSAGAKTGTAQYGEKDNTHAWFTVFAPFDNPEIVVTVLVEGGGEGYKAALPVAKEVLQKYFE